MTRPKKKKRKLWIGLVIALTALAIVAIIVVKFMNVDSKTMESQEIVGEQTEYYIVPSVEQVYINGVITPNQSEEFMADNEKGEVQNLTVQNGDSVAKGDVLFEYFSQATQDQVDELVNQINQQETARANQAYKNQIEINKFWQTPEEERTMTAAELDANYNTWDMDAEINAQYDALENLKAKTVEIVYAPFAGVVEIPSTKTAETPVLRLVSQDFYLSGTVNEKDLERLAIDQAADITVNSTGTVITGKVATIGQNPSTGDETNSADMMGSSGSTSMSTYPVRLTVDTTEGIKNGYHVQASINLEDQQISIPKEAVQTDGDRTYVLANEFGTIIEKDIKLGEEQGEEVVVTSGLSAEDYVVVTNPAGLTAGDQEDPGMGIILNDDMAIDGQDVTESVEK
ncbi:MAG TPA: efflux RND transporter periplasmic adaptor subunit [Bavariicoccus seileri]|uniref:Efflux RND transporter periplasmic adaptor subunit n=1 Tax=Bavariicoccus seileri TaxID=549685 RepID=A0A3D4S4X0_9ENTE|nr:efflux RND transporter periplasmic adaptor subunit [Bavariicoccus seileri]HCS93864.1 efflux RND transporter periplasmic adaptor subunit [Bavariicoccus seileri]